MVDENLKQLFRSELLPREHILWSGQPQKPHFPLLAVVMCVMSGLFLLIGLTMLIGMLFTGNVFTSVFMFIWTAIAGWNFYFGLNMIFAPMKQRYAVTNERVLIIQTGKRHRIASIRGVVLSQIERSGNDNIGTLDFGKKQSDLFMFANATKPSLDSFMNIENPRKIEKLILEKLIKD